MTQYKRITGKVFGGNATATGDDPQIAQFGSALANTFVGTTDPATIQQLPAWGQGWIGAVTPETQFPPLPEMTGAMKVLSHQICGILQQGVSTWDSETIYYTGNFCSKNGIVYVSLSDLNQGNDPEADTANWRNYGGADIDLSNLSDIGKNIGNWSTNVTNCWTKIPQRIKYTLEDGTLTILAGSVLIFPYGTQDLTAQYPVGSEFLSQYYKVADTYWDGSKFFVWAETKQNHSITYGGVRNNLLMVAYYLGNFNLTDQVNATSGATAPSQASYRQFWYDTTNNYVKNYNSNTSEFTYASLPVMLVNCIEADKFEVNNVFNGWGYIGAVKWKEALEGLISDGYNEDGTYKNIAIKLPKISMESYTTILMRDYIISSDGSTQSPDFTRCFSQEEEPNITGTTSNNWYNPKTNKSYQFNGTNWVERPSLRLFTYNGDGTNVTSVTNTPQTFRPLEYSDKAMISSWSMPSNNYIDLTLGASGTEYTAPANGWVTFWKKATTNNQYIHLNNNLGLGWSTYSTGNGTNLILTLPVVKNQTFKVNYNATGVTEHFRFIYAEGEQ